MINPLLETFNDLFNRDDGLVFFSPGRLNLIGEHIDYNGGLVLPFAIDKGIYGVAGLRQDRMINVLSKPFTNTIYQFSLDDLKKNSAYAWADYIKGSLKALIDHGYMITKGFDLYLESDLAIGAGLSSSAALEMLIIYMVNDFFDFKIDPLTMAKLGQYCEQHFIGVKSGIMDQCAIIMSKKDHALLLDTMNLHTTYVPFRFNDYTLIIANTNKKRNLIDSKYNERFQECQTALIQLKKHYPITHLCEIPIGELNHIQNLIDINLFKRVRHIISEHDRTYQCSNLLSDASVQAFSNLINQSHRSLKEDYDVTGIELDTLQEALLSSGATCARMTGAGFGGCALALIKNERVEKVIQQASKIYTNKIGYEPSFDIIHSSDGTHKIENAS